MTTHRAFQALLALTLVTAACGDDAATPSDARVDASDIDAAGPKSYTQVEHLARPGINEALLISQDFLAGYNATAPSFTGVPQPTLDAVVGEAKTVLKALYLGGCLLNGVLGLTPAIGVKPAGAQCNAVGGALFVENSLAGVTLTQASKDAAQAYADRVFAQFIPDVMRVNMAVATSSYESLCGDPTMPLPLLCGGRFLDDDTIDTTYDYLLNGAATPQGVAATYNQFSALVSDGVNFGVAGNKNNRVPSNAGNAAQFHPAVSNAFPYSANPL